MLSQKAKYALRALLVLAEADADQPVLIADIAERHHLPRKFLEQILLDLKHHGLVQSRRGAAAAITCSGRRPRSRSVRWCGSSTARSPRCPVSAGWLIGGARTARLRRPARSAACSR